MREKKNGVKYTKVHLYFVRPGAEFIYQDEQFIFLGGNSKNLGFFANSKDGTINCFNGKTIVEVIN